MDRTHWERLQEVFHHALDLPAAEQRAYLQAACGDDETLLTEAQAMLAQDALGRSLLDGDPPVVGETCPEDTAPFLPPDEFGPYRIRKLLGEGGMGIVYLAEREDFGNLVAIKILRNDVLSPSRRRRFTDEQRTLARMEHPLIARIYDADTLSDGTPWFAMEYRLTEKHAQVMRELWVRFAVFGLEDQAALPEPAACFHVGSVAIEVEDVIVAGVGAQVLAQLVEGGRAQDVHVRGEIL
jgi:hypothetical protein